MASSSAALMPDTPPSVITLPYSGVLGYQTLGVLSHQMSAAEALEAFFSADIPIAEGLGILIAAKLPNAKALGELLAADIPLAVTIARLHSADIPNPNAEALGQLVALDTELAGALRNLLSAEDIPIAEALGHILSTDLPIAEALGLLLSADIPKAEALRHLIAANIPNTPNTEALGHQTCISADIPSTEAPKKRKCGTVIETFEGVVLRKARKVVGRPKNAWTASRSRKLVRLYLMTSLDVDEIVKVLRTKHFAPCKRDVQKQLQTLLQSRPGKIRSRGRMTKIRLTLLRECRDLEATRTSQQSDESRQYVPSNTETAQSNESSDLPSSCLDTLTTDSLRPDSICSTAAISIGSSSTSIIDFSWSENEHPPYSECSGNTSAPSGLKFFLPNSVSRSKIDISSPPDEPLSGPIQASLHSEIFSSPSQVDARPRARRRKSQRRHTTVTTTVTAGKASRPSGIPSQPPMLTMEGNRVIEFTMESCRASIASIDSLRNRLANKTESCVQDVISVLQNLTIPGSSKASSMPNIDRSWKAPSTISVMPEETDQGSAKHIKTIVALPFISQEKVLLQHDLHLPGYFANLAPILVKPKIISVLGLKTEKSSLCNPFGHSILHAAAASGERPQHLLEFINLGANVHTLNSGGETFLHLVSYITSGDHMHLGHLFAKLKVEGFNFYHRDDHGQTALHHLTRQWVDALAFESIADNLLLYETTLPSSRDNLGRTILGQMRDVGLQIPAIAHLEQRAGAQDKSAKNQAELNEGQSAHTITQSNGTQTNCLPNYGPQTYIETINDLRTYEVHADLLRTIFKASSFPQHEDLEGRNGLHCLAEVSLSLPIPCPLPSNKTNANYPFLTRREAYLSDLLKAGVDPDNCDHAGITPLMAFILHARDDEDDATTVRILACLRGAGANINRRDRNGQTPLHLAVKLGRVAVTRFLLDHGANIHARDSHGKSVVKVGKAHCDKESNDAKFYAQIMMCISCVVDAGAVSAPTFMQEWGKK